MDAQRLMYLTTLPVLAIFLSQPAFAVEETRRLIETSEGQRQWMSEKEIFTLSKSVHATGRCGGFFDVTEYPDEVAEFGKVSREFDARVPTQQAVVEPLILNVEADRLNAHVKALSGFKNRYYQSDTGVASAMWIKDQFTQLAGGRADITVEVVTHSFKQPTIIARIRGNGPLADQRVIMGAHQDSINQSATSANSMVAPGADDDASGMATVLEAFRILAQSGYQPARTLEFMAYAGEEAGLLGSQDVARKYKAAKTPVFGVVQFDMTMYPGDARTMTLMQDYVDPGLTQFMKTLLDTYIKVPWGVDRCGYGCSDHASWSRAGYPSAIPFETAMDSYNPKIHSSGDLMNLLDASFGAHFAKLAVAFAVEMSSEP